MNEMLATKGFAGKLSVAGEPVTFISEFKVFINYRFQLPSVVCTLVLNRHEHQEQEPGIQVALKWPITTNYWRYRKSGHHSHEVA